MTAADTPEREEERARPARGRPFQNVNDRRSVSMLGIGMVIGSVIGAGIALLVAPQSGPETRRRLTKRVDRIRGKGSAWRRLGRELRRAAAAKQKAMAIEAKREEIRNRADAAVT